MPSPMELETSQSNVKKGNELKAQGNIEGAIERYERAIELNPDRPAEIYTKLGKAFRQKRQLDKALSSYLKAIEIDPSLSVPYLKLKYIPIAPNRADEVITCYRRAIDGNRKVPLVAYIRLGDLLTQQGKLKEAIECYKTAIYRKTRRKSAEFVKHQWNSQNFRGPDFLIAGVGKCGTTALSSYLDCHPQVLPALEKEIHFFNLKTNFCQGIDWYNAHFPAIPEHSEFITGEATPWYLNTREVDRHIFEYFPQVKLIIILRNPVDRAFSQYNMHIEQGLETRSFEEVVDSEIEKLKQIDNPFEKSNIRKLGCLGIGMYVCFLERWMNRFPKDQFLIVKSEELNSNPDIVMKKVFSFLSLPDYNQINYKKYNPGSYSPIPKEIKHKLVDFFQPYNEKLNNYIKMDF